MEGRQGVCVGRGVIHDTPAVAERAVLGADARIITTGADRMRGEHLAGEVYDRAFAQLAQIHPDAASDITEVAGLAPFFHATQGRPNVTLPFSPLGCPARVATARDAAGRLVALSQFS